MMRMRYIAAVTIFSLSFLLAACRSKSAEQTAQTQPAAPRSAEQPQAPAAQPTPPPVTTVHTAKPSAIRPAARAHGASVVPATAAETKPLEQRQVVPAGTVITVRLAQELSSKTNKTGDSFTATLAQPLSVDGKSLIPEGTTVSGKVSEAVPLGRFKGQATLHLVLDSITLNGHQQPIQTSNFIEAAKGKGTRTATMIGGGAGVGALIGGLAGGGKGAAIGALAGAGAGTAGAGLTGNKDIVLPAEAAIAFKLEEPFAIKP